MASRLSRLALGVLVALGTASVAYAGPYIFGPQLTGAYQSVTISVTAATGTTVRAVAGSTLARGLAVLRNCGPTYDLYWGEGASAATVGAWHKLSAGAEATIYTCNYAPGTWGAANKGVYIAVTVTPYTENVADFRSYKLFR